jgi:sec-independent protein translocase protein TatC
MPAGAPAGLRVGGVLSGETETDRSACLLAGRSMGTSEQDEKVMDFWDHLEELRWVIFKSLGVLVFTTLVSLVFTRHVFRLLLLPVESRGLRDKVRMIYTTPLDAFVIKLKMALVIGIAVALPFIIAFVWSFVSPGLKPRERKAVWWIGGSATVFFSLGVAFGYLVLFSMLPILASFGEDGVQQMWQLREYLDFCLQMLLGIGVSFELPVVVVILVRIGLLSVEKLRRFRPYAIVVVFVLAAVLTPSPDGFTQVVIALPLVLLYELSIVVSAWQDRIWPKARDEESETE